MCETIANERHRHIPLDQDRYGRFHELPEDFVEMQEDVDGLSINYVRPGRVEPGSTSPILFVHGVGSSWRAWAPVAAELADDFDVILLDLPGFGFSDRPPGQLRIEKVTPLLDKFCQQLGLDPAIVCAHSMGVLASIHFAVDYPDRVEKLLLLSGHLISALEIYRAPLEFLKRRPGASVLFVAQTLTLAVPWPMWLRRGILHNRFTRSLMLGKFAAHPDRFEPALLDRIARSMSNRSVLAVTVNALNYDYRVYFGQVRQPVVLMAGELDGLVPIADIERFTDVCPAQVIVFDGGSHWTHNEDPYTVAGCLRGQFGQGDAASDRRAPS